MEQSKFNIFKEVSSIVFPKIYIVVGYIVIFSVIFFITISTSFAISPIFTKWFLNCLFHIDINQLNNIATSDALYEEVIVLKEKINFLESNNNMLESKLSLAKAEKEGIINGIKHIKIETVESNTYSPVKITIVIVGVVIILGIGYALFSSGHDFGGFSKSSLSQAATYSNLAVSAVRESNTTVCKNIEKTSMQLQDIEVDVKVLYDFVMSNHGRWEK
jgi:hypothetical protein